MKKHFLLKSIVSFCAMQMHMHVCSILKYNLFANVNTVFVDFVCIYSHCDFKYLYVT
jgi:hypothetical protein